VAAGDRFGFYVSTNDGLEGPGTFTPSNFSAPECGCAGARDLAPGWRPTGSGGLASPPGIETAIPQYLPGFKPSDLREKLLVPLIWLLAKSE